MSRQAVIANPPVCWVCDRMLWARGRYYVKAVDKDTGRIVPVHTGCSRPETLRQQGMELL